MTFLKLTLISAGTPVYINANHISSVGVAYQTIEPSIKGMKPITKAAGTLVNLSNGTNHGVVEDLDLVMAHLQGI